MDAARFVEVAAGTRFYVPALVAITTARSGAVSCSRCAENVDLDGAKLAVVETLEQTRAGLRVKEPKTQKSRRVIALGPTSVETLRHHRAEQLEARMARGSAYNDNGLVLPRPDGSAWQPDSFTAAFRAFARGAGFAGLRFHDLRHSHATHLLAQNIHPKIVSERLGHSNIGITIDTYSHVVRGMQEAAALESDLALQAGFEQHIGARPANAFGRCV